MKALVLGCGSIGIRHIQHLRRLGVERVEAADPSPEARERVKAGVGLVADPSPEEALGRRPDVVLVCTPASTHVKVASKALEAGAHVFIEKPLAISLEGTREFLAQAQADGRVVQVGYQLRYHPAMRLAHEIVRLGRLGKVLTAEAQFGLYLERWWPGRDYRGSYMVNDEISGGLLLDVSHEIDLLMWLLGGVREVFAHGAKLSRLEITGMDVIHILMKMDGGELATLRMDCLEPVYTRNLTLTGEGTGLRWDCPEGRADSSVGRLQVCEMGSEQFRPVSTKGHPSDAYLEELRDFLAAIKEGRSPMVGVEQAIEVLRVVEAVRVSLETGQPAPIERSSR